MMPDYGEAVSSLRNLPHLWGRGTAIAVEGVLPKVALTIRHQYPSRSAATHPPQAVPPPSKEGGLVGALAAPPQMES